MPCYDSRNDPENVEKETTQRLMKEFTHNSPVAEMLCEAMTLIEDNNLKDKISPALRDWWRAHQTRDEQKAAEGDKHGMKQDVIVDMGDMRNATIEQAEVDDNFESMVEDYVGTYNHAVIQGMAPIRALVALASATGILLGCAVRSGMRISVGSKIISMIVQHCDSSSKQIHIITKN